MENVEQTEKDSGVVLIGNSIIKCYRAIVQKLQKNEDSTKELETLKGLVVNGGKTSSLLATQTFVRLCDDGVLNSERILALLMPIVQTSSLTQFCSLVSCITELLLVDLRHQLAMKSIYKCPYQIIQLQHPLLLMIPSPASSKSKFNDDQERLQYILDQIQRIFNHHDRRVSDNSSEFLKPILLYCFTTCMHTSQTWKSLLVKGKKGDLLYQEVILFAKSSDIPSALYANSLLMKAAKYFLNQRDDSEVLSITLCLINSCINLVEEGFSAEANLELVLRIIFELEDFSSNLANLMLMLFADLLQIISPFDLPQLLRILTKLIIQKQHGNFLSLFMILDGLIQRAAYPSFSTDSLTEIEEIITFISTKDTKKRFFDDFGEKVPNSYIFFNEKIAIYYEFDTFLKSIGHLTKEIIAHSKSLFEKYPLVPRAFFLSSQLRYDAWLEIFKQLLDINKCSKAMQNTWLMPYLYKIANEMHPKTKNLLLKSLPEFGQKDPVVNTIKVLAGSVGKAYTIDLYMRLWKKEPRCYALLHEALKVKSGGKSENYELSVTKAFTIKEICELRPSQHGAELVHILSEILNDGDDFELPIIQTLETLAILCENHVVNIVSTWKAISFKFRYEKRPRVLQSLFHFFSKVPLLKSPMEDFQKFVREVLSKLWTNALHNTENNSEVCSTAIHTIGQFSLDSLMLSEIPDSLIKDLIKAPKEKDLHAPEIPETEIVAPPEIWIKLMEQVYRQCIDAVADVLSRHISKEITDFRGGVYLVPEGKPEPKDMKALPEKSILRVVGQFLIQQSRQQTSDDYVISGLLKALTPKFSKAMPPLDWSFLHEFFHNGQEIKHHCLRILGNQLSISGSSRRMIENYINNFDANNFQEEEIAVLYEKLPELCDFVSPIVFTQFIRKSMAYANSPESSHLLLDHILTSLLPALSRDAENTENYECLCMAVEQSMQTLDVNDELFEKFTKLAKALPLKTLDRMITTGLEGKTVTMFKKSLIIIKEICSSKGTLENPLNWLTQAVERANKDSSYQPVMLEKLIEIFRIFKESTKSFKWISELLAKIQNLLTTSSDVKSGASNRSTGSASLAAIKYDDCVFLLDVFLTVIITISGHGFLLTGSLENYIERSCKSFRLFPQSLSAVLATEIWKDNQGRIFEFLYHFYLHSGVPETYADTFKNAIICSKNHPYFQQQKVWHKFVMMRR